MIQPNKPVSKFKVILLWAVLIGNVVFWTAFWTLRNRPEAPPSDPEQESGIARFVFMIVVGGFFLVSGLAAYFLFILTNGLTFDFTRPFFGAYKAKLYLAKIVVPTLVLIGLALMLGAFLGPVLQGFGLHGQISFFLPLILTIVPIQIAQMWVNIWSPMAKKLIGKRLAARGIPPVRMATALLVGISNPLKSSFKKMTLVEEDVGALWIGGPELVYCGDTDQFSISRAQIVQIERRADAGSTSMLSGTAHVILHVQLPDGTVRQIRFHVEGHWTQGLSRRAMDDLAAAITRWHESAVSAPPPIAAA